MLAPVKNKDLFQVTPPRMFESKFLASQSEEVHHRNDSFKAVARTSQKQPPLKVPSGIDMTTYSANRSYDHTPASIVVSRFRKPNLNILNDYAFEPINPKEARMRRDLSMSIIDQQESHRYDRKEDSRGSGMGSVERTR